MAFTDRKLETGILVLSVVLLGGLGYVLKTPVQSVILGQDIVYEMPRIKKSFLASLFDLGDREVDRSYTNPFAKKKAEEKKKEEAKKAEVAAAKAAAAKAVAKKAAETKKPKVEINTVQAAPTKTWGDDGFFGNSNPQNGAQVAAGNGGNNAADSDADKSDMTGDQWKALLRAQPTADNVAKLVAAYSKQEVDTETFYSIVADLYKSNKPETQALGLAAVKSFYNANSFVVTTQYMDQFTTDMQKNAHDYLDSYASGRLAALAAVLKGSDTEAIAEAARVVLEGYEKAKSGTSLSTDPRNTRGNVVLSNSVSDYAQFYAIFQVLTGHQDAEIAGLASSGVAKIPNPNAVASL